MARTAPTTMGFPPFYGAVRNLIILNTGIFLLLLLLRSVAENLASWILQHGVLFPESVFRGQVWQIITYGFLHLDPFNFLMSMLGIYFIGTAVESQTGSKKFIELYCLSLILSAVVGLLLSLTGVVAQGAAMGSGPAANATLMAFYLFYRDARVSPMFIPIPIPVKYIVIFTAAVETAYLLLSHFSLMMTVQLLGLGSGYIWYRLMWRRRSLSGIFSNRFYSIQNSYHRWKRRRAGKKFQVYMKKHNQDPSDYFDEHGNFRPPDDKDKTNGGNSGGWVN